MGRWWRVVDGVVEELVVVQANPGLEVWHEESRYSVQTDADINGLLGISLAERRRSIFRLCW